MITDLLKDKMPPLPPYHGRYRIIYLEPIANSGERLTIGIMATGENESRVLQTISPKKIKCMYGDHAPGMTNLISLIVTSASEHIDSGLDIEEWMPPFSGVQASPARQTRYNKDLGNMLFQAITSYSSLYEGELVDNVIQQIDDGDHDNDEATSQLITSVKNSLGNKYQSRFKKKVSLLKGDIITIDYLGVKFNADIANFDIAQVGNAERNAKAKLLDLQILRDERQREQINPNIEFGFLLFEPETKSAKKEASIRQIIHMAESNAIPLVLCNSVEQVADTIRQADPT